MMTYNIKRTISNERQSYKAENLDQILPKINRHESEDNDNNHKTAEQKMAPHLVEHSKLLRTTAAAIQGAFWGSVLVLGGIAAKDAGVSAYRSVEYVREMPTVAELQKMPNLPAGIVTISGKKTNEVFGTVYLDYADGTSYYTGTDSSGMPYLPNKHSFSVLLNTHIEITSSSGNQTLQVQNTLNATKEKGVYLDYNDSSEIYRLPCISELSAVKRGIEDAFSPELHIINPINGMTGNGYISLTGGADNPAQFYAYSRYKEMMKFPVSIGLDIAVEKKGDNVVINFSQFPVKKGILDMADRDIIDTVTYHVNGLESAYIVFNKDYDTGLTIKGAGSRTELLSKNLEGVFSLYEIENKQITPLLMSGTKDWSILGGAYNVKTYGDGSNYVVVETEHKASS